MKYSQYQKNVFDKILHGIENIVIEASAGAAKTTTIVKSLDYIQEDKQILFIAFNTSIVDELRNKIGEKQNVRVCTMHSLGRELLKQHGYPVELKENKYTSFIQNNAMFANMTLKLDDKQVTKMIGNIKQLISLCRNFLSRTEKQIKEVADRYSIRCTLGEIKVVKAALEWGRETVDCIDFDDMIWLPNVLNLRPRYVQYDFIFLDEAQDANKAQIELFKRFRKNGTRMIVVGDKDQSIYNFRGVDGTTFDELKAMGNTITLPLSISYRCPKRIVEYARQFSDNIEPWDDAQEGEVNFNVSVSKIKDESLILCRNNAPLVYMYLMLLQQKRNASITGNEKVLDTIREWAVNSNYSLLSYDKKENGFVPQLWKMLFDKRDEWCNSYNETEEQVMMSPAFKDLYDLVKSAETLCYGLERIPELLHRLSEISSTLSTGIKLSTVHKAKGTECDDVYIICDSLMPSKSAKSDWEIDEERHIQYVAYTRSKKTLNFVSEEEFKDFTDKKNDFVTRMRALEKDINKITGREKTINQEFKFIDNSFVDTIITAVTSAQTKNIVKTTRKSNVKSAPKTNYLQSKTTKRKR